MTLKRLSVGGLALSDNTSAPRKYCNFNRSDICENAVRASSGSAFLAARGPITDGAIAPAATGEPDLNFPAKSGTARIIARDINAPTHAELCLFARARLTPDPLGEFVPVSPLIAQTLTFPANTNVIRKVKNLYAPAQSK